MTEALLSVMLLACLNSILLLDTICYIEQTVLIPRHILFSFPWHCDAGKADLYLTYLAVRFTRVHRVPQTALEPPQIQAF